MLKVSFDFDFSKSFCKYHLTCNVRAELAVCDVSVSVHHPPFSIIMMLTRCQIVSRDNTTSQQQPEKIVFNHQSQKILNESVSLRPIRGESRFKSNQSSVHFCGLVACHINILLFQVYNYQAAPTDLQSIISGLEWRGAF